MKNLENAIKTIIIQNSKGLDSGSITTKIVDLDTIASKILEEINNPKTGLSVENYEFNLKVHGVSKDELDKELKQ